MLSIYPLIFINYIIGLVINIANFLQYNIRKVNEIEIIIVISCNIKLD
jgi:hypothetical protein